MKKYFPVLFMIFNISTCSAQAESCMRGDPTIYQNNLSHIAENCDAMLERSKVLSFSTSNLFDPKATRQSLWIDFMKSFINTRITSFVDVRKEDPDGTFNSWLGSYRVDLNGYPTNFPMWDSTGIVEYLNLDDTFFSEATDWKIGSDAWTQISNILTTMIYTVDFTHYPATGTVLKSFYTNGESLYRNANGLITQTTVTPFVGTDQTGWDNSRFYYRLFAKKTIIHDYLNRDVVWYTGEQFFEIRDEEYCNYNIDYLYTDSVTIALPIPAWDGCIPVVDVYYSFSDSVEDIVTNKAKHMFETYCWIATNPRPSCTITCEYSNIWTGRNVEAYRYVTTTLLGNTGTSLLIRSGTINIFPEWDLNFNDGHESCNDSIGYVWYCYTSNTFHYTATTGIDLYYENKTDLVSSYPLFLKKWNTTSGFKRY